MDGYPPQHHMYVRPPQLPPTTLDPHQFQHYQHLQRSSIPPQNSWYSSQFQYQPPSSSHSPSPPPPPPPPHHWVPQPPVPPLPPPPHPSSHPYPTQIPSQNHLFAPRLPGPPSTTQSYTQEWGDPNLGQRQAWDHAAHNNAEDWAAKAKAWAAAKQASTDDQHPQPQMASSSRPEEQSHYYNQFSQDHYQDVQQQAFPASGYQQFPASASAPPRQAPVVYMQNTAPLSSGQSSYVVECLLPGSSAGAPITGSFVHQPELPSSYSSVTGIAKTADQNEQLQKSHLFPASQTQEGQSHLQPSLSAMSRSLLTEEPFVYGNYAADSTPDLHDQPLNFDPGYNHKHDPHMLSSSTAHYDSAGTLPGVDPSASVPSVNSWTPAVTSGTVYPRLSSVLSSGSQHDPTTAVPSPVPGHASSAFGSFPGSNYQTIPPTGMPYGLGAGPALHQAAGFPGDTYGVSNVSERPKKASVPNWLKDEIIKKASIMTRPSLEHTQEETFGSVDKSLGKSDLTDTQSIDSSRSNEEEEDDEDYTVAAKAAAINQEIKRILTEVLLKVTDELFDEIATKVLDEEDLMVEGKHNSLPELSSSPPAVPITMASGKVLVGHKAKESETEHVNEESSSGSVGDILGLANYASDEDDGGIQSNYKPNSRENVVLQQSSATKISEGMHDVAENGISQSEPGKHSQEALDNDVSEMISVMSNNNFNAAISELNDLKNSSKVAFQSRDFGFSIDGCKRSGSDKGSWLKANPEDATMQSEPLDELDSMKKLVEDDFGVGETRVKSDQDNGREIRNHSAKGIVKEAERSRADKKVDANHHRQDGRNQIKESKDVQSGPKDGKSERVDEMGEKVELHRRASGLDAKKNSKEGEKSHGNNAMEDTDRKRERANNKDEDRARYKLSSDSHKRRRSPSINSQGRNSKYHDSSDEASYDSKRKQHSRKRQPSPSPARSGRRQVSRSPHSKHSQRRHSPYSSLEKNRYVYLQFASLIVSILFETLATICSRGEIIKLHTSYAKFSGFSITALSFRGRRWRSKSPVRRCR